MGTEQERIRQIMEDTARGKDLGAKLHYDPNTKRIQMISKDHDPEWGTKITPTDADLY